MNIIKPKNLKNGDTIAIIAPCGNVNIDKINNAKKYFEKCGYKVKLGKNIGCANNYLAGSDNKRLEDLHNAFLDTDVDAIICARGGYGAIRLINKINYEIIRQNPKIFCGFSDVTALSLMIFKRAGLITYSSPMAQSDFSAESINEFTKTEFFKALQGEMTQIIPEYKFTYHTGKAKGRLIGGNLATVASLCGQDFIPDEKFIFFAEELNEPTYKIDRYFTQLLNIEKFRQNVAGIALGDFLDVDNPESLDNLFKELADELKIPIVAGFPFSHEKEKTTAAIGEMVEFSPNEISFINN